MYLKNIHIENIGAIEKLSLECSFDEEGLPKPLIFVGKNGSGKTTLLSSIMDAFYEIGGSLFTDIRKEKGAAYNYYKINGGSNVRVGVTNSSFAALSFSNDKKNIEYLDRNNDAVIKKLDINNFTLKLDTSGKRISAFSEAEKKDVQKKWNNNSYFYMPANRYEEPFWKNKEFYKDFDTEDVYRNTYGNVLEILSSSQKNKQFLLDIILDSKINLKDLLVENTRTIFSNNTLLLSSINCILSNVKNVKNVILALGARGSSSRVCINDGKKVLSLDSLSLGEAVLFNMFVNIIRYSCRYNVKNLAEINGIVVIDEVDLHLHADLQNKILPQLIKLFPRVQFILTTHSPLFLLGMEKEFGRDGFDIINMPMGEKISTDRFSEFGRAYNIYGDIKSFEEKAYTEEEVRKIIQNGENEKIEFKASFRYCYKDKKFNKPLENIIVKTIASFLNSEGGDLFIGIEDNGNILGLENDLAHCSNSFDKFQRTLSQVLDSAFDEKSIMSNIKIRSLNIDDKEICIVYTRKSHKPVFVKDDFFVRINDSCKKIAGKEVHEYIKDHFIDERN